VERLLLIARWPGLAAFLIGGVLLAWRLLMPELAPRDMLRWGRGRVENAMVPLGGPRAAPGLAGTAMTVGAVTLLLGGILLVLAFGPLGLLLAPLLAVVVGWTVAQRRAAQRRERLAEQAMGLAQALAAGLSGEGSSVFTLLRRSYYQLVPPLKEELYFLELVLRGQADLGESLERAAGEAVEKHVRGLLELLALVYRESLDLEAQRRALRTLLERMRRDDQVYRTVRIESRFGQTSQSIVLFLIPGFVVLAALAGSFLESEVSVSDFYLHTLPGRLILLVALLVEGLVVWVSRRMMRGIRWD